MSRPPRGRSNLHLVNHDLDAADTGWNTPVPELLDRYLRRLNAEAREHPRRWGRSRRVLARRRTQAHWSILADRDLPAVMLAEQEATRDPNLVPIRNARMLASPFAFFRGSAALMAADLAATPSSGILVHSCGDAHIANFGVYATPERRLDFDLNDFDEAAFAPFEWDVKRLATAIVLAGREAGVSEADCRHSAVAAARRYRERMARLARMRFLDVWYSRIDASAVLDLLERPGDKSRRNVVARLRRHTNAGSLDRLTEIRAGRRRLRDDPPLVDHVGDSDLDDLDRALRLYRATLLPYRQALLDLYRPVDFVRKIVGVGSVGLQAWVVLMLGRDDDDPLLLQVKEARPSALERFVPEMPVVPHAGMRVVFGQRVLQSASDIFLGWFTGPESGRHYYVRQLRDMKGSLDLPALGRSRLRAYSVACGHALARAHARSGEAPVIAGYLGGSAQFDNAIGDFALSYAGQTAVDYRAMVDAANEGKLSRIAL